jgi:HEAT repeat protein
MTTAALHRSLRRAGIALAVCTALTAEGRGPDPPTADLRAENLEMRRKAAIELFSAGKDAQKAALPVLIELLQSEKDGQVRLAVLDTVTALGPDAAPAVEALVYTLKTDYGGQNKEELHQDYRAALALAAIGPPAVEGLRSVLREKKVNVRAEAAMALGRIGPEAASAIPDLIGLLADNSDRVGNEAARALGAIGAEALRPLIEACSDPKPPIRARAVAALGPLAAADANARSVILDRCRDEAPEVRAAAISSAAGLDLPDDTILPILEAALSDAQPEARLAAVNALVRQPARLDPLVPRLRALLTSNDAGIVRHAAFLLRTRGPDAAPLMLEALSHEHAPIEPIAEELAHLGRSAAGSIIPALAAENARVRRGAALALGQIRPLPAGAFEKLVAGLGDPDTDARAAFLAAVGHLGPRPDAVQPVRGMLRDPAPEIRLQAIQVLFRLAPRDATLLADLSASVDDADPRIQRTALDAIRSLGPLGRAALSAAIEKLNSPSIEVRRAAAELIASHGPSAAEAVPALTDLLADPSPEIRALAAQTLGSLGTAAQPALPELAALLNGQPVEVRAAVAATLGSLELDAEAIRPYLAPALRDEPDVRRAALRSIQRLGPRASLFLPDIILMAANPGERRDVERSLRRFERNGPDPRSVPDLVKHLSHEQEAVRLLAIKFLGLAGSKAREALPALERLRDDPSIEVRQQAEAATQRIKGEPGAG